MDDSGEELDSKRVTSRPAERIWQAAEVPVMPVPIIAMRFLGGLLLGGGGGKWVGILFEIFVQWFVPGSVCVEEMDLRIVGSVFWRAVEHGWKTTFSVSRCYSSWAVKGCSVYSTRSEWKKPLNDNLQIKRLPSERLLRSDENGRQATVNAVSDLPKKTDIMAVARPQRGNGAGSVASHRIAISVER